MPQEVDNMRYMGQVAKITEAKYFRATDKKIERSTLRSIILKRQK